MRSIHGLLQSTEYKFMSALCQAGLGEIRKAYGRKISDDTLIELSSIYQV